MDDIMLLSVPQNTPSHPYWWSPEIHQAHRCLLYWKIKKTESCVGLPMTLQLENIIDQLGPSFDIYEGKKERYIPAQIRIAVANIQSDSYNIRQNFLLKLASDVDEDNPQRAKRLKQLRRAEALLQTYSKLKRYLKPNHSNGLTFLEITNQEGNTEQVVIPEEINSALLEQHSQHFFQAHGTPFTKSSFTEMFGENTDTELAKSFREGTIDIEPTPDASLNEFIIQLTPHSNDPPPIDDTITLKQLKQVK